MHTFLCISAQKSVHKDQKFLVCIRIIFVVKLNHGGIWKCSEKDTPIAIDIQY